MDDVAVLVLLALFVLLVLYLLVNLCLRFQPLRSGKRPVYWWAWYPFRWEKWPRGPENQHD